MGLQGAGGASPGFSPALPEGSLGSQRRPGTPYPAFPHPWWGDTAQSAHPPFPGSMVKDGPLILLADRARGPVCLSMPLAPTELASHGSSLEGIRPNASST